MILLAASKIKISPFRYGGTQPMIFTMGPSAPSLNAGSYISPIFESCTKDVTIRIPATATGYTDTWKGLLTRGNSNVPLFFEYR